MNRWILVALIVAAFVLDSAQANCEHDDDDEDECCQVKKQHKDRQRTVTATKPPVEPELPSLDFPKINQTQQVVLHFTGPYLPLPAILKPNHGLRGPLAEQQDVLMMVMQQDCNLVIYNYNVSRDNVLWHSKTHDRGVNCSLHVNDNWTIDVRNRNGLKTWSAGLKHAYLEKATRAILIPTREKEDELHIRLVLFNVDGSKNLIIE